MQIWICSPNLTIKYVLSHLFTFCVCYGYCYLLRITSRSLQGGTQCTFICIFLYEHFQRSIYPFRLHQHETGMHQISTQSTVEQVFFVSGYFSKFSKKILKLQSSEIFPKNFLVIGCLSCSECSRHCLTHLPCALA